MSITAGSTVRIKDDWPEARGPVHCRTPHDVRGKRGTVMRRLGDFPDPGDIAVAREPAMRGLYHVAIPLSELWPERPAGELVIEIYDHWLEQEGGA